MRKIFVLAVLFFASFGALNAGEELHLVIGSTRRASRAVDSLFERFWREDPERLGHSQTFEGKATTMDRRASQGSGPHITADASKYSFGGRVVRRVYVERVETGPDLAGEITESALEGDNLIGSIVGNVALAMPPGSVLVNEWHPYVRLLGAGFTPEQLQRFVRLNPFTGFIRFDAAMAAAASLAENSEVRGPTPAIIAEASSLQPLLRQLLGFYIQRGMGSAEQIRRRLREEIFLIQEILGRVIN